MKYLDKYPNWSPSRYPHQPDEESVDRWLQYINDRYEVKSSNGISYISIDYKTYYLSGPLFNKSRITQKIFLDITEDESLSGSQIHIPSLRKAIKNWIDLNSKPIKESFKNTDEEILMFFTDYYDENPENFKIKNVLVFDNKEVVEETPYMKTPSKYRKGKLIKVRISKPDGIRFTGSSSLTSIEVLQDLLSDIERFYDLSGEDNINYKINMDYMGLSVEFLVLGEYMKDSDSKVKIVDDLLVEFKDLFKKRGFRPSLKSNSVEIKTSSKKSWSHYGDYSIDLRNILKRINDGEINLENLPRPNWRDLVEWRNKVHQNGLTISISGGDHQVLIKLRNQ